MGQRKKKHNEGKQDEQDEALIDGLKDDEYTEEEDYPSADEVDDEEEDYSSADGVEDEEEAVNNVALTSCLRRIGEAERKVRAALEDLTRLHDYLRKDRRRRDKRGERQ